MIYTGVLNVIPVAKEPLEVDGLGRVIFENGLAWGWLQPIGPGQAEEIRRSERLALSEAHALTVAPDEAIMATERWIDEMLQARMIQIGDQYRDGPPQGWGRFFWQLGKARNARAAARRRGGGHRSMDVLQAVKGQVELEFCAFCGRKLIYPDWFSCSWCEREGLGS